MINIYTLTSTLHDPERIERESQGFLQEIFPQNDYQLLGGDFSTYGTGGLDLIFVRTGGAEGIFLQHIQDLYNRGAREFILLTSGSNNSLAASMEILSFLGKAGLKGEILHGPAGYIRERIATLERIAQAREALDGLRLGVLGEPSDWLIASDVDIDAVREAFGIGLVGVPMDEVVEAVKGARPADIKIPQETLTAAAPEVREAVPGALQIHAGLEKILEEWELGGFTLRCFDLLKAVGNTGCLSLAEFNARGIPAGCEGDIPALISMAVAKALTGHTGFMANPSRIDVETGEMVFAHCTIPLDIVDGYTFDTHFESGIGVGIRGHYPEQDVTILKIAGDLSRVFVTEGRLEENLCEKDLCRTQIRIRLDDPSPVKNYFLTAPIGNHHIIVPGRWKALLEEFIPRQHHCCGHGGHGGGHGHGGGGCCGHHHH